MRLKYWELPLGYPHQADRRWVRVRAKVRAAATQGCQREVCVHEEDECCIFESCGDCPACEANTLIEIGAV